MRIAMHVCPTKFLAARRILIDKAPRILDIGCGNNSPSTTKRWFPGCYYAGADIAQYNNTEGDLEAMDVFYPLGVDGSGYDEMPDRSFDFIILHHVVEHMPDPAPILQKLCSKLKAGGVMWIAFPSVRSLSLPSAEGTLQFCDDPTHVYLPDKREIANILMASGIRVIHAGRSKDPARWVIGFFVLPFAFLRRALTGRLASKGLWYILGFEDHVLGRRDTVH